MDNTQYLNGVTDALTSSVVKWKTPVGFALIDWIRQKASVLVPQGNSASIDELARSLYRALFQTITFRFYDNVKDM